MTAAGFTQRPVVRAGQHSGLLGQAPPPALWTVLTFR
jgi:hypothetical protein